MGSLFLAGLFLFVFSTSIFADVVTILSKTKNSWTVGLSVVSLVLSAIMAFLSLLAVIGGAFFI